MLELNPEIVCAVIERAREFQAQEEVTIPEAAVDPSDEDWAMQVLASHSNNLSLQEARELIQDLEPDQQATLVALMWLGRGDFGADEWEDAYTEANETWNERTADYLMATPMVSDYLIEGLAELGYSCES